MSPAKKRRVPRRVPDFEVTGRAVPREFFPSGRVRFSPGGGSVGEARARIAEIRKLVTWRAWDVLKAVQNGALDAGNVATAVKAQGESAVVTLRAAASARTTTALPSVSGERDAYLAWYGSGRREEHSVKQVTSRLKCFCEVALDVDGSRREVGSLPVARLDGPLTEAAINTRWKAGATREAIRVAVSGLYSWSIERERARAKRGGEVPRWDENPASAVEAYERLPRVVTASEPQVVALMEHAEIHQSAYVRAFVHMGMRDDELIHTRAHLDLNTETWIWNIQGRGPDERHGCIQCRRSGWTPKNRRATRTLLVPGSPGGLRAAIVAYLEAYPCDPGDFVFRNPRTGKPWDAGALDRDFHALCKRAGVKYGRRVPGGITLHDLRATCATRLVQAKERESVIAALLGDTVATIVATYVRLTEEDTARAVSNGPSYSIG